MSELTFTKTFLSSLDSRPAKIPSDHIFDPKTFVPHVPYTLPRLAHPYHPSMPKKTSLTSAPGSTPTGSTSNLTSPTTPITLILKSTRNPVLTITLQNAAAEITTLHDLKTYLQHHLDGSIDLEKIKILHNRKPVTGGNGKTVVDILGSVDANAEVELGVMVMGGAVATTASETIDLAPAPPPPSSAPVEAEPASTQSQPSPVPLTKEDSVPPVQGISGAEVLKTDEFWSDLHSFLLQRVKDESEAERLTDLFRKTWSGV